MTDSVRVAVRVRPFNEREKERNAKLIIKMVGPTTIINNPENETEEKKFTFDYSYWSHDGFSVADDGLMIPTDDQYADQAKVFAELGRDVLDNAFKGFNCSLFAYGQTGSGKSYSMVGYGVNKGIVPVTADAIFKHINANTEPDKKKFEVQFSMLEIYNESVRDLLSKENPKGGLKVRLHPKLGAQVVGLQEVPVGSFAEIEKRIEQGTSNRTIGMTQMNATSSRAHTVVAIIFKQIELNAKGPGKHRQLVSKINLVDLAGSERADSTGATGDRLKEGSAINLSLSMLGNVITALAEQSNNPKKKILIPYRDSKLTQILQDALGGNSKTIMIAALSPADINYQETLSTLRYADRAKQIKNKAIINIDPMEQLIMNLKEENAKLLAQLELLKANGGGVVAVVDNHDVIIDNENHHENEEKEEKEEEGKENLNLSSVNKDVANPAANAEREAEVQRVIEEMAEMQKMMDEQNKSWEDKLASARVEASKEDMEKIKAQEKKKFVPHLRNLNEDPMLSGAVWFFFDDDESSIGRKDAVPTPTIALSGLNILKQHAIVKKKKKMNNTGGDTSNQDEYVIETFSNSRTLHNGKVMTDEKEEILQNGDRLLFGSNHMYVFVNPMENRGTESNLNISWEDAQEEIAREQGFDTSSSKKISEMSERERNEFLLRNELVRILPMCTEANMIAEELKKPIRFEVEIVNKLVDGKFSTYLVVAVTNEVTDVKWMWSQDKFVNRSFIIRELYQNYIENGMEAIANIKKENDPFWDPVEVQLIGTAVVHLTSLSHMIEFNNTVEVKDYKGKNEGLAYVELQPCLRDGRIPDEDDEENDLFVEDPSELLGKRIDFLIVIRAVKGINAKYQKGIHVCFSLFGKEYKTSVVSGTINPQFEYRRQITIEKVSKNDLQILTNGMISLEVYGLPEEKDSSLKSAAMPKAFSTITPSTMATSTTIPATVYGNNNSNNNNNNNNNNNTISENNQGEENNSKKKLASSTSVKFLIQPTVMQATQVTQATQATVIPQLENSKLNEKDSSNHLEDDLSATNSSNLSKTAEIAAPAERNNIGALKRAYSTNVRETSEEFQRLQAELAKYQSDNNILEQRIKRLLARLNEIEEIVNKAVVDEKIDLNVAAAVTNCLKHSGRSFSNLCSIANGGKDDDDGVDDDDENGNINDNAGSAVVNNEKNVPMIVDAVENIENNTIVNNNNNKIVAIKEKEIKISKSSEPLSSSTIINTSNSKSNDNMNVVVKGKDLLANDSSNITNEDAVSVSKGTKHTEIENNTITINNNNDRGVNKGNKISVNQNSEKSALCELL